MECKLYRTTNGISLHIVFFLSFWFCFFFIHLNYSFVFFFFFKQIYGTNGGGTINQGYEHVNEDDDGNSLRLTTRNPPQVTWGTNTNNTGRM